MLKLLIFVPIICFIVLCIIVEKIKIKQWNNGVCFNCNKGFWISFDICSGGEVGYKCTNCDTTIWI